MPTKVLGHRYRISKEPGFGPRLMVLIITTLASAAVSSITVSWVVSSQWTAMKDNAQKLFENQLKMEGRLESIEKQQTTTTDVNHAQDVVLAENKAHNEDEVRRLGIIEGKIDGLSQQMLSLQESKRK